MWTLETTDLFDTRSKRMQKRYDREWSGAMANANTYLTALNNGVKPLQIAAAYGFVRSEGKDVYRVNQGKGKSLAEIRLYLYPEPVNRILYLLTMGDKQSQPEDIKDSHRLVKDILSKLGQDHGSDESQTEAGQTPETGREVQDHGGTDPAAGG